MDKTTLDTTLKKLSYFARLEIQGSNSAEVDGCFQDVKILSTRDFKLAVPNLRFQAR